MDEALPIDPLRDRPGLCSTCGRALNIAGGDLLVRPCRYCLRLICGSCRPEHACHQMMVTPDMIAAGISQGPHDPVEVIEEIDGTVLSVEGGPQDGFIKLEGREVLPFPLADEPSRPRRRYRRYEPEEDAVAEPHAHTTSFAVRWAVVLGVAALVFSVLAFGLMVWMATSFSAHMSSTPGEHQRMESGITRNATRIDALERELDRQHRIDIEHKADIDGLKARTHELETRRR